MVVFYQSLHRIMDWNGFVSSHLPSETEFGLLFPAEYKIANSDYMDMLTRLTYQGCSQVYSWEWKGP